MNSVDKAPKDYPDGNYITTRLFRIGQGTLPARGLMVWNFPKGTYLKVADFNINHITTKAVYVWDVNLEYWKPLMNSSHRPWGISNENDRDRRFYYDLFMQGVKKLTPKQMKYAIGDDWNEI